MLLLGGWRGNRARRGREQSSGRIARASASFMLRSPVRASPVSLPCWLCCGGGLSAAAPGVSQAGGV
eukprot:8015844-Pyramimonas_sp.AAC.1